MHAPGVSHSGWGNHLKEASGGRRLRDIGHGHKLHAFFAAMWMLFCLLALLSVSGEGDKSDCADLG